MQALDSMNTAVSLLTELIALDTTTTHFPAVAKVDCLLVTQWDVNHLLFYNDTVKVATYQVKKVKTQKQ